MGIIKVDIRYPNGMRETTDIEGERALIGSASYCDVRLPMDQTAYEHVLLEVHGDTLRAEVKADDPPATLNGVPFTASPLSANSVLGFGNIRLMVSYVSSSVEGLTIKARDKKSDSNPLIRIVILVAGGAAAFLFLMDEPADIAPPPQEAPELFSANTAACPQSQPGPALALAAEQMDIAIGKQERMPFSAHEGVAAVDLYETAAACFRVGKEDRRAKDAAEHAQFLKHALVDDFRARRLRLQHMLAVKDWELVKNDVKVLQALTAGQKGKYVAWLASVDKQLEKKGFKR